LAPARNLLVAHCGVPREHRKNNGRLLEIIGVHRVSQVGVAVASVCRLDETGA